jgi:hypothetical protein
MSLGGLLSRVVGVVLIGVGGWLLVQGQLPVVAVIVAGSGVVFFVGARLSR